MAHKNYPGTRPKSTSGKMKRGKRHLAGPMQDKYGISEKTHNQKNRVTGRPSNVGGTRKAKDY